MERLACRRVPWPLTSWPLSAGEVRLRSAKEVRQSILLDSKLTPTRANKAPATEQRIAETARLAVPEGLCRAGLQLDKYEQLSLTMRLRKVTTQLSSGRLDDGDWRAPVVCTARSGGVDRGWPEWPEHWCCKLFDGQNSHVER